MLTRKAFAGVFLDHFFTFGAFNFPQTIFIKLNTYNFQSVLYPPRIFVS
jgi:hypothetical protein